jgi:2-octaprenyl-6-methoxyphenol hydroxylase
LPEICADVAVVGGGPIGTSLALALAAAGATVALIERATPTALADVAFDGRATAVALGGQRLLARLGVWEALAPAAGPIDDIRVSDGASRLFLHYDHRQVGGDPFGWIVENAALRAALWAAVTAMSAIRAVTGAEVTGTTITTNGARLALADGRGVRARLVAACDGRGSAQRRHAGIAATGDRYPQTALVFAVRHAEPHRRVAHERFLPGGPFALLPLADLHRSSVVWTERTPLAEHLLTLDDRRLAAEMLARFGDCLGAFTPEGRRWRWPLAVHVAHQFMGDRLALVGDAAHGIHPIAGQGFNLGLRDVEALAMAVGASLDLGLDPGRPEALDGYDRARRGDVLRMVVATDGLNRLFSNADPALALARRLGLGAVERMGPLKGFFMRQAMGVGRR